MKSSIFTALFLIASCTAHGRVTVTSNLPEVLSSLENKLVAFEKENPTAVTLAFDFLFSKHIQIGRTYTKQFKNGTYIITTSFPAHSTPSDLKLIVGGCVSEGSTTITTVTHNIDGNGSSSKHETKTTTLICYIPQDLYKYMERIAQTRAG